MLMTLPTAFFLKGLIVPFFFMTYINGQEIWFNTPPTLEFYCRKDNVVKIMHILQELNYLKDL